MEDFPYKSANTRYEIWWRPSYSEYWEPFILEEYNEIKEVTDMHWAWVEGFRTQYPLAEFTIISSVVTTTFTQIKESKNVKR